MDPERRERFAAVVLNEATDASRQARWTAPLMILLGILFCVAAFSIGAKYEWKMDAWTQGGTRTGPLWVIFPALLMTGVGLIAAGILYVRAKARELREAIARVENSQA